MLAHPPRRKPFLLEGLVAVATLTGLEPATSAVTGRHANQLRYRALVCCFLSYLVLNNTSGHRSA